MIKHEGIQGVTGTSRVNTGVQNRKVLLVKVGRNSCKEFVGVVGMDGNLKALLFRGKSRKDARSRCRDRIG